MKCNNSRIDEIPVPITPGTVDTIKSGWEQTSEANVEMIRKNTDIYIYQRSLSVIIQLCLRIWANYQRTIILKMLQISVYVLYIL